MKTARTLYEAAVLTVGYAALALVCAVTPFILWSSGRIVPIIMLSAIGYAYLLKSRGETGETRWPIRKL